MEFTLRAASPADYRWLWELKRLTMRPYVEQTWGSWDDEAQEEFFSRNFSAETVQVVVVEGRDAALLEVTREPGEIFLANVQVHPDFQQRGLGTAIVANVLISGQTLQLPVRLQVLRVNLRAQRLYERLGFAVYATTPTHTLMRWRPPARRADAADPLRP